METIPGKGQPDKLPAPEGKKSWSKEKPRGKYSKGKSIRKRDIVEHIAVEEAGHREADTVVSGQGKSKACFATLAERKTRFYIAVKIPDKKAGTMENAIVSALSRVSPHSWSRPLPVTGGRSLPTGAELRSGSIVTSILPTPIVPGRKAQTKTSMVCSGSFIPRAETSPDVASCHTPKTKPGVD